MKPASYFHSIGIGDAPFINNNYGHQSNSSKASHQLKKYLFLIFLFNIFFLKSFTQVLDKYNIVWNTPSKNASESMPCGGGDIGMNVWVENGDVLVYVARSGSLNEDNAMFKSGRIRLKLFPNPFTGKIFKQELHLQEGYTTIDGENNGIKATVKIWADVFNPVCHFNINASNKINITAAYETWRYQDRKIMPRENYANSWKWAAPKNNIYKKDEISFTENKIMFYHANGERTIFDTTLTQQGLQAYKDEMYNPLKNLIFGGLFYGENFVPAGNDTGTYVNTDYKSWNLKTKSSASKLDLYLVLQTEQNASVDEWQKHLAENTIAAKDKNAINKNVAWWKEFWSRSFINIQTDSVNSKGWEIGRNYQLFRFQLALNANGKWPTKFNGGLLTVDPQFTDVGNKFLTPDYRNWGGGLQTAQNQRLVYFPMIKSGDWDLLKPQMEFYLRILKNAELRSKVYWNHAGASFTEQMENYGLPNYAEYGQKRPDTFDKGVEYNAWLEYLWDTSLEFCLMMLEEERYTSKNIETEIPFIESCLIFFYEHYKYEANKRTARPLDNNGKMTLYPGSGAETFKITTNSTATIAALQTITKRLLALPNNYVKEESRKYFDSCLNKLPPISFTSFNGKPTIAPAKSWQRINNVESPQLYPVFPWHIYGVGIPGLDTAINTWNLDTNVIKFRSPVGWKQDNIWAANLGLVKDAWNLNVQKLQSSNRRFPTFWGPGFDWVPDHNWGGSGMIGLQEMLLQTIDKRILLFPSWPVDKDVHFKLHAPYNTTVEAELKNGKITLLKVVPETRKNDVEIMMKSN